MCKNGIICLTVVWSVLCCEAMRMRISEQDASLCRSVKAFGSNALDKLTFDHNKKTKDAVFLSNTEQAIVKIRWLRSLMQAIADRSSIDVEGFRVIDFSVIEESICDELYGSAAAAITRLMDRVDLIIRKLDVISHGKNGAVRQQADTFKNEISELGQIHHDNE
ncbi:MAG: hypothetical protein LBG04_03400 [Holosporaceae bacterium]|jgi:hypothetical protein|nr:hypothetical protein [Holosporaceae bacterium]